MSRRFPKDRISNVLVALITAQPATLIDTTRYIQWRVELTSVHGERLQFGAPALASAPAPASQLTLLPHVLRLHLDGLPFELRDGEPNNARPVPVLA